jgi:membrane protein DedA with SNARE-associated domain
LHCRRREALPSWLDGKPFAITFAVLFVIVLLRAQATYWLGRGVTAGVLHTRFAGKITGPRTTKAIARLNRWGLPLVTVSFLTIGLQTVINGAAGLIRMPWIRYTIAMLIGCVAWALIYATVGIAAFEGALALAAHSPWALVVALAVAIGVVVAIIVVRRRHRADPAPSPDVAQQPDARLT